MTQSDTDKAILVHIDFRQPQTKEDLDEFKDLVHAAGASPTSIITGMRTSPDSKYFVGSGKAEEIRAAVLLDKADVVLFNHELTPSQERNLETLVKCRVLDRTGLILDIFAQRARTFEGKLQVELAQLVHLSTRLVRGWTHLERQKGGIGLRGPGETQLETDRRLLGARIKNIHTKLNKVRKQRDLSRQARRRATKPVVSLVGYTNAGKSTLFNGLTDSDIYTADKLFATLDPTLRRINLRGKSDVILADTVGFIRHLPHDLIEAFRATLEETRDANLLVHVIDASSPQLTEQVEQVNAVLEEIAAVNIPQIMVYNKIDCMDGVEPHVMRNKDGKVDKVWLSALNKEGLGLLKDAIVEYVFGDPVYRSLCLSSHEGRLRAVLYDMDAVLSERVDKDGNWWISIKLSKLEYEKWLQIYQGEKKDTG